MAAKCLCLIVVAGLLLPANVAGADDIVYHDHIIDCLGAPWPSGAEESMNVRTRGLSPSRAVSFEQRGIAVSPKQVVLRLLFKFDSTELADEQSHAQLTELGLALASPQLHHITVEIEGHTCNLGPDAYNERLSHKRAERIERDLVIRYGIDPGRIRAEGYGERYPIAANTCEENRRLNRRVVITRLE